MPFFLDILNHPQFEQDTEITLSNFMSKRQIIYNHMINIT